MSRENIDTSQANLSGDVTHTSKKEKKKKQKNEDESIYMEEEEREEIPGRNNSPGISSIKAGLFLEDDSDLKKLQQLMDFFNRRVDPTKLERLYKKYKRNFTIMQEMNIELKKKSQQNLEKLEELTIRFEKFKELHISCSVSMQIKSAQEINNFTTHEQKNTKLKGREKYNYKLRRSVNVSERVLALDNDFWHSFKPTETMLTMFKKVKKILTLHNSNLRMNIYQWEYDIRVTAFDFHFKISKSNAVSENKLFSLFLNSIYFSQNAKVRLFTKLCSISPRSDWGIEELKLFEFLSHELYTDEFKTNVMVVIRDEIEYIPYEQVQKYIISKYSKPVQQELFQKLSNCIIKIPLRSGTHAGYEQSFVDSDSTILEIIYNNIINKRENKEFLEYVFDAADINLNGLMDFFEFAILYRHIEGSLDSILIKDIKHYINKEQNDMELIMTKQIFIEICSIHNIFSQEKILGFLGIELGDGHLELAEQYIRLRIKGKNMIREIKYKLDEITSITDEQASAWNIALEDCEQQFNNEMLSMKDNLMIHLLLKVKLIEHEVFRIVFKEKIGVADEVEQEQTDNMENN